MANRTDPLVSQLAGTDPQNLLEYITRQNIYDGRYWKETCFGLSVEDTLVEASKLKSLGGLPSHFLALTLKLLQLHPDTDLVIETFIGQDDFKYVRALGCMYLRLTAKPPEIYSTLEQYYDDQRKLRCWQKPNWKIIHMDEFIHSLLSESRVLGIALPRLPQRRQLVEAGYLEDEVRLTKLQKMIDQHGGDPVAYLRHKALVEEYPPAASMWKERLARLGISEKKIAKKSMEKEKPRHEDGSPEKRPKKKSKYGSLFKQEKEPKKAAQEKVKSAGAAEGSTEYWNDERAKLGLKPLKE